MHEEFAHACLVRLLKILSNFKASFINKRYFKGKLVGKIVLLSFMYGAQTIPLWQAVEQAACHFNVKT